MEMINAIKANVRRDIKERKGHEDAKVLLKFLLLLEYYYKIELVIKKKKKIIKLIFSILVLIAHIAIFFIDYKIAICLILIMTGNNIIQRKNLK